jgi:hypothetical protein
MYSVNSCDSDAVTFETDGTVCGINGFALLRAGLEGWVDIRESDVWIDLGDGLNVNIGPVIDLGPPPLRSSRRAAGRAELGCMHRFGNPAVVRRISGRCPPIRCRVSVV